MYIVSLVVIFLITLAFGALTHFFWSTGIFLPALVVGSMVFGYLMACLEKAQSSKEMRNDACIGFILGGLCLIGAIVFMLRADSDVINWHSMLTAIPTDHPILLGFIALGINFVTTGVILVLTSDLKFENTFSWPKKRALFRTTLDGKMLGFNIPNDN